LLVALALAWSLARWLLAPIHALAAGTHTLAAGDYGARIALRRKDELGELASDFNRLAETLARNRETRRQWTADIAHELRTPLSILRGEVQALQDGVRQVGAATLESLNAECERLSALVDDLYQLALSDEGGLEYRLVELDLAEVLRAAVEEHARALAACGLTLALELAPSTALPVAADAQRLRQLCANLLANTQRYTDAPGRVRITVEGDAQDWHVHVDDTAPGVPAAALPRLFDRLYRVESSRSRAAGGAGLGLAICKNIAQAHGGCIAASASPLGGLRVSVSLPRLQLGK